MKTRPAQLALILACLLACLVGSLVPCFRVVAKGGAQDVPWVWCGDLNGDGVTNIYDFLLVIERWGEYGVDDLLEVILNWQQDARGWWVIFDGTEPPHAVELEAP